MISIPHMDICHNFPLGLVFGVSVCMILGVTLGFKSSLLPLTSAQSMCVKLRKVFCDPS